MLVTALIILVTFVVTFLIVAAILTFLTWYYEPERYLTRKFSKNLGATVAYGMNVSRYAKRRPKLEDAFIVGVKINAPKPRHFETWRERIRNVKQYGEYHVTYEFCILKENKKIRREWKPSIMMYTDKRLLLTERSML